MKFDWVSGVLTLTIAVTGSWLTLRKTEWPKAPQDPQNILIISICSFRSDLLTAFSKDKQVTMPNVEKFFSRGSIVVQNSFNGVPWTSLFDFFKPYTAILEELGVQVLSGFRSYPYVRVPPRRSFAHPELKAVDDNNFEKTFEPSGIELRRRIFAARDRPFFLIAHFKYMHYPLIDRINADSEWDYYLNPEEKEVIQDLVDHPDRHLISLPFLMLLENDPKVAKLDSDIRNRSKDLRSRDLAGLVANKELLDRWRKSPNFPKEKVILEKIYRANARYLDKKLAPLLNLYGDRDLQKRTVVMLTGDHGEVHMERGELTHAISVFDESLRIPTLMKFPNSGGRNQVIQEQTHLGDLSYLVSEILKGHVREAEVPKTLAKAREDTLVLRDCLNAVRGIRYKNTYKYIVDNSSGQRFLFDLKRDPLEKVNVAPDHPEMVEFLETEYWRRYWMFTSVPTKRCPDWS
ncbi:MAG: sulfatase-like hydrolase/transferase [Bdellovibrionales bacterium]